MATFPCLLKKEIENERNSQIVIDKVHAYGIIKLKLDAFWNEIICEDAYEQPMHNIPHMINIALAVQNAAEQLNPLVEKEPVISKDGIVPEGELTYRVMLEGLIESIENCKKIAKPLQKGKKRWSFEFDEAGHNAFRESFYRKKEKDGNCSHIF